MISLAKRFLFIHVPKTAGNSIQSILARYSDDEIVQDRPHHDGVDEFGVVNKQYGTRKHATMSDYKRVLKARVFADLYKFAVVRNPWDRMVSWYFSPHRRVEQFDRSKFIDFVRSRPTLREHVVVRRRFERLRTSVGAAPRPLTADLDYLIRYESLNEDLAVVLDRLEIPFQPLPVKNKSKREHYAAYYDEELRDVVADRFREEIDVFGYEFTTPMGATPCLSSAAV